MTRIGDVPEINAVKLDLDALMQAGAVERWELPYENILTRLTAAIFFVNLRDASHALEVWGALGRHPRMTYRGNSERLLSQLEWRVEFNKGLEP